MEYKELIEILCLYCKNDIPISITSFCNSFKGITLTYEYLKYKIDNNLPKDHHYRIKSDNENNNRVMLYNITLFKLNDNDKENFVICDQIDKFNMKIIAITECPYSSNCIAINPKYKEYVRNN